MASIAALIDSGEAWGDPGRTSPRAPTPRIELGFRDGTTAALDPDCEQALALEELAILLNFRD